VIYSDDGATGNRVTLTSDGTHVVFGDATAAAEVLSSDIGAPVNDCEPGSALDTVACPTGPVKVTLGLGDDTLTLGNDLPLVDVDGNTGTDRLDFTPHTAGMTLDLRVPEVAPNVTASNVEAITGSQGDDLITGDDGPNRLSGGDGTDHLIGGGGANVLRGGPGVDTLDAGPAGDSLVGGPGADVITGGAGDDDISAADGVADQISCGAGTDTVSADPTDTFPVDNDCEEITVAAATSPDPVPTPTPDPIVTTTETSVIFVPALGSIVPVLAPGPANIADLIPPGASMRSATRQRVATVLSRGVPVRVTCRESCGISVALSVDRATARRLKLDARSSPVVIGTASATRTIAGTTHLRVKFTKRARTALKRSARSVATTTQVLVSDASGNGTLLSRHVMLVR
jgi:hypothetical protein